MMKINQRELIFFCFFMENFINVLITVLKKQKFFKFKKYFNFYNI